MPAFSSAAILNSKSYSESDENKQELLEKWPSKRYLADAWSRNLLFLRDEPKECCFLLIANLAEIRGDSSSFHLSWVQLPETFYNEDVSGQESGRSNCYLHDNPSFSLFTHSLSSLITFLLYTCIFSGVWWIFVNTKHVLDMLLALHLWLRHDTTWLPNSKCMTKLLLSSVSKSNCLNSITTQLNSFPLTSSVSLPHHPPPTSPNPPSQEILCNYFHFIWWFLRLCSRSLFVFNEHLMTLFSVRFFLR